MANASININTPKYHILAKIAEQGDLMRAKHALQSDIDDDKHTLMSLNRELDSAPDIERRRKMFTMALRGNTSYRDLMTDAEVERMDLLTKMMAKSEALSAFGTTYSTLVN